MAARQTVTATVTKEVKLKPALKTKLLVHARQWLELKDQLKRIELQMDEHKFMIGEIRESTGEDAIEVDGFKFSRIAPIRKVLNHKKLVELGCAMAWIEEATENVPSKAYEKITAPGGD